jgi:hypothetical protein
MINRALSLFFIMLVAATAHAQIAYQSASQAYGLNTFIALVGTGNAPTRDDCGAITPSIPTGSTGDILIAVVNARELGATLTKSTAWTQYHAGNYNGDEEVSVAIYYRIADGVNDSLTVTQAGTCSSLAAQVARFSGVDTSSPFEGTIATKTGNAKKLATETITTTSSDAMLLVATALGDNQSVTQPSDWSSAFDSSLNVSRDLQISLKYQLQTSAGSKSFSNWDIGGKKDETYYSMLFALKPASGGGRNISIPMPSGVVANDLLIASVAVRYNAATVSPPSGWALISDGTDTLDSQQVSGASSCSSGTTAGIRLLSYYKVAVAGEPTATFSYSSTCNDTGFGAGGILRFTGVDVSNPFVDVAKALTTTSTSHAAPAVSPGVANTMLATVHAYGSSRLWSTTPTSMTERVDQRSYDADQSTGTTLGMFTQSLSATGSTGTRTAIGAGDADNGATHSITLRPGGLDHIRIEHDGSGAGCAPETVTVKACTNAACSALYSGTVTTTLSPSGWSSNPLTFTGGSATATLTVTSAGTVTLGAASTTPTASNATRCFNGATETCAMTVSACPSATCASGTLTSGIINTYYPGTASVSAGATIISIGAASGASTVLAANDLVLIQQMQDAVITTGNDSGYGVASAVNAGKYEYAKVASVGVGTVTLTTALSNGYTSLTPSSDATQQKTFQVIRVPVYSSGTLPASGLTAKAWDGSSGGVLVFDVIGALALNSATVDLTGKGFRGGGGYGSTSGSGSSTDYRTPARTNGANGAKGEGIAGASYRMFNGTTTITGSWEGYVNGSAARGAPANAGGGGTDGNPGSNDENTGGGGGANKGSGGKGGIGWCGEFDENDPSPYGCSDSGGVGGAAVSALAATQLTLGGGGGAATSNNSTGTPGAGVASSGAAGGGIVMIRAGTLTGAATFNVNGADANDTVCNDGSGGGGGGGVAMISAASGISGVTINAKGGEGGTNLNPSSCSSAPHGPGGGGGGGYAITTSAPAACVTTGGASGKSYDGGVDFGAYGAGAGSSGACATSATLATSLPGKVLGEGPCSSVLAHYAISYPLGNPGVTCEALAVRITGHDAADGEVAPAGTQITLTTTPATGGWALKTGTAANFTGGNKYTFDGTEKYAEFWLTQTTATTAPHIDIDVTDGSKTDTDGSASEDAKAQFTDTAFKYYACAGATCSGSCSEVAINDQIAGKDSSASPNEQLLCLRAVRSTPASQCAAALNGAQNVDFAYECDNPATCYGSNMLSINGGSATTIQRNNDGTVSSGGGSYSPVSMTFDASGYAPFNFIYSDVGKITLHARKIVSAGSGTPPSSGYTLYQSSNSFVVKPYGFKLSGLSCATADNKSAVAGAFCVAGGTFTGTVTSVIYDSSQSSNLGAATPSFGREASAQTVSFSPSALVMPTVAAGGALSAFTSSSVGSFSGTPNVSTATMVWPNVGTFTIKPTMDYLGTGDMTAAGISDSTTFAGNVGRFYPDRFTLLSGAVTPACSTFTYMGQPFSLAYTLEARNKNGAAITGNYFYAASGGYNTVATPVLVAEDGLAANQGADLGSRISGLGSPVWSAGSYVVSSSSAVFSRPTAPVNLVVSTPATFAEAWNPFDLLAVGVKSVDADGAVVASGDLRATTSGVCTTPGTLAATDCDAKQIGSSTKMRYGLLWLGNAYGTDQANLAVPFVTRYWNGSAFVKNTLDNCTALAPGNISLGNKQGGLTAYTGPVSVSAISGGAGTITLPKPGTATAGSVDLVAVAGTAGTTTNCGGLSGGATAGLSHLTGLWCGSSYVNPTARATFGIFGSSLKKGPIYIRENF